MKILIIHHLEPMWESGYKRYGTSFETLQEKLVEFLAENEFDKVILTRFEENRLDENYWPALADKINSVQEYGYGWDASCLEENPNDFVEGGNHSEAVYVPEWMKSLGKFDSILICGAFRGECLEDLEIALNSLELIFRHVNELCVG